MTNSPLYIYPSSLSVHLLLGALNLFKVITDRYVVIAILFFSVCFIVLLCSLLSALLKMQKLTKERLSQKLHKQWIIGPEFEPRPFFNFS